MKYIKFIKENLIVYRKMDKFIKFVLDNEDQEIRFYFQDISQEHEKVPYTLDNSSENFSKFEIEKFEEFIISDKPGFFVIDLIK